MDLQGNGAQGFPNPNNETLQPDMTIKGTHKPMQPLFVIAIDHKNVETAPNHVVQCGATFNTLHPRGNSLDISNSKSPRTSFIHFHMVELLVQPTQDILVRQPISYPQKGPFHQEWYSKYAFYKQKGRQGAHLARPSLPSPSFVEQGVFCGTRAIGGGAKRSTSKSHD